MNQLNHITNEIICFIFFSIIFILSSCLKNNNYPNEPIITFISATPNVVKEGIDDIFIKFSFTDGDGDLGVIETDTAAVDLIYTIYRVQSTNADFTGRLPYITQSGNNKALAGEVELKFSSGFLLQPPLTQDTIYYDIKIKDRAGNTSNTITTTKILVTK